MIDRRCERGRIIFCVFVFHQGSHGGRGGVSGLLMEAKSGPLSDDLLTLEIEIYNIFAGH